MSSYEDLLSDYMLEMAGQPLRRLDKTVQEIGEARVEINPRYTSASLEGGRARGPVVLQ